VNLDEEAANLIRFQQAYQAAARVMGIAGTLFEEVLGVARG
jgi:flagellar hook-associated protein 1 FlgK